MAARTCLIPTTLWSAGFREAFTDVSRSVGLKSCIPGPIRNDDIEGTDRSLRCYLQDGYNFKLLPEPVWDKLVAWYGLDSMSRVHRRFAHDIGGKCEVETSFFFLAGRCWLDRVSLTSRLLGGCFVFFLGRGLSAQALL